MSIPGIVMVMAVVMTTVPGGKPVVFGGLEWRVGPDRNMRWDEARSWADSLGEGWRLPSIEELEGLYEAGVSVEAWGPFQCGGEWVWADFPGAWSFLHGDGVGYPTGMEPSTDHRAFAVRTAGGHEQ